MCAIVGCCVSICIVAANVTIKLYDIVERQTTFPFTADTAPMWYR